MYILFENELGGIRIAGGGDSPWRLIAAEGLNPVRYDAQTAYMSGREGRSTTALYSVERTIVLKGDIEIKNSDRALTKAAEILSREGRLKLYANNKKRMIYARCTAFEAERERGGIRTFVMQFVCDDPFFTDFSAEERDIMTVKKLIYGSFTLNGGIYFSLGHANSIVTNKGVKETEPIITAVCANDMQGNLIKIINRTTGQVLELDISLNAGDTLIVDIPDRQVLLNGEEKFDILSHNSFLSDFYLAAGNNEIAVETNHNSDRLKAKVCYFNRYTEAEF